jgi:tetratricopeptide (TPR) repeat protein
MNAEETHGSSSTTPLRLLAILCTLFALAAYGQADRETIGSITSALRSSDFSGALSICQTALAKDPGDYRVWTLHGMASAGAGDSSKALADYQHALRLEPGYLPALEGAAQTEFDQGSDQAIPLLEQILAQRPDDATSHMLLAVLEYRKKDCSGAITHFEKATAVIASQRAALTDYGLCLAAADRNEDAARIFAQALALDPAQSEARYNLALAQWNAHETDDALQTLDPLTTATPGNVDALALAADISESKGDTARAVELLREALTVDPRDVGVYLQFATLSFDHASPQVGIDILSFGLTQVPNEPRLYLVRGILLTQLGEFVRAAQDFDSASRIDPRLQFVGVAEGLVRSQQHNSAEALAKFRAAVKAHPNEAYAHYLLAEALLEEDTRQNGSEDQEEVQEAKRAVALDPKLAAAHDLLATVYLESGDTAQAISQSRAALAVDSDDQQAIYHLIVALRKTRDKDEIPALLKRLVELRAKGGQVAPAKKYRLYEEKPLANSATSSSPPNQ